MINSVQTISHMGEKCHGKTVNEKRVNDLKIVHPLGIRGMGVKN